MDVSGCLEINSFGRTKGKGFKQERLATLENYLFKKSDLFNNVSYHLEIGFGYGEHLLFKANSNPAINYIGCEVYLNGLCNILKHIQLQSLQNILLYPHDARLLLKHLPENSLDKVYILFPDPWPKRRAHKRRLINEQLLFLLASKMNKGAQIIIATDDANYAMWIERAILNTKLFDFQKVKSDCMNEIITRYHAKSTLDINWFQCKKM